MSRTGIGLERDGLHRYYLNGEGPIPSVTTITGILDKPGLTRWIREQIAGAAYDELERLARDKARGDRAAAIAYLVNRRDDSAQARDYGTSVHALTEELDRGNDPDVPEECATDLAAYLRWRDEQITAFPLIEAYVAHLDFPYAGTLDRLAVIDGEVWLLDLKTSKSVADKKGNVWPEMRLQLAGYGHATIVGWPDIADTEPMPAVDHYGIVQIRDGRARLYPADVTDADWEAFGHCVRIYQWSQAR